MIREALIGFLCALAFAGNALAETAELFSSEYWADSDKDTCAIGFYGTGHLHDRRLFNVRGSYFAIFEATRQPALVIQISAKDHANSTWRARKVISARFRFADGKKG